MPRPPRIEYHNACYHVMNRGAAKNQIFCNEKSYEIFLEILGEACEKFEVIVHCYCLMTNHYHLLVQTPKANLSKFMHHLTFHYVRRYNKFMQIDGPMFRGRFKSKIVEEESYFLGLNRYIHLNPLDFVDDPESYKWSSYSAYLGLSKAQTWLNKDTTLNILGMSDNLFAYKEWCRMPAAPNLKASSIFKL